MYKLSKITILITFCFFYLQTSAQNEDTTKINNGNDNILYFELVQNHDLIRKLVFFNKDTTFYNDNILNCSACGGMITESLDTVYFYKSYLVIEQSTDDLTDKILFKKINNNYQLIQIRRTFYGGSKNRIKKYKFKNKNILLSNMVYADFLDFPSP